MYFFLYIGLLLIIIYIGSLISYILGNFINNDMGIKLYDNSNVIINNSNFINNTTYGLGIYTEDPICNISYCNSWNNGEYDYMENCPG